MFACLCVAVFLVASGLFLVLNGKQEKKNQHEDWHVNPQTLVIDGCEYLIFQDPNSYNKFSVTHKGNCSSSSHKSHP